MADDKSGRDAHADNAERRQRERELQEALDRADEAEPAPDTAGPRLGRLDESLGTYEYPVTASELIEAYGDRMVETQQGRRSIEDVLVAIDTDTYESADEVRHRILSQIHRG